MERTCSRISARPQQTALRSQTRRCTRCETGRKIRGGHLVREVLVGKTDCALQLRDLTFVTHSTSRGVYVLGSATAVGMEGSCSNSLFSRTSMRYRPSLRPSCTICCISLWYATSIHKSSLALYLLQRSRHRSKEAFSQRSQLNCGRSAE